ncbi:MAG: hypothetical protein ACREE4_22670 [Stellaceae bacterium]
MPPVVPRSEARPHLAAIVRHVAAGNEVLVGSSEKTAYSKFISLDEFERQRKSFSASPIDVNIDDLRRRWSFEREQVENSGRPVCILLKGEPSVAFVPTPHAMKKKIARTREALGQTHIETQIEQLSRSIAALKRRFP